MIKRDVLIIGSGPAGLQAAIYAARKKVSVLVIGKFADSSLERNEIDNYYGFKSPVNGTDLLRSGRAQAEKFGAEFHPEDVLSIIREQHIFTIKTDTGEIIEAKAIIIATGISRTKLGLKDEAKYQGRGISYCVDCDGFYYKNKKVALVGDGSAAVSGALLMAKYTDQVILVSKKLNVVREFKTQLDASPVKQMPGQKITEILGDGKKVVGFKADQGEKVEVDGIFIELGAKGVVELFMPLGVDLTPGQLNYIVANKKQETNVSGVFAAGDICGPPFQIAKSVGEGCLAGIFASDYVKSLK
ncbi:MAG: FAD-dependent oxidoreductase [Planctomycetes bacterium]|nr:FAD-dependent oxidoreductase [Planctomycetota bacterium]